MTLTEPDGRRWLLSGYASPASLEAALSQQAASACGTLPQDSTLVMHLAYQRGDAGRVTSSTVLRARDWPGAVRRLADEALTAFAALEGRRRPAAPEAPTGLLEEAADLASTAGRLAQAVQLLRAPGGLTSLGNPQAIGQLLETLFKAADDGEKLPDGVEDDLAKALEPAIERLLQRPDALVAMLRGRTDALRKAGAAAGAKVGQENPDLVKEALAHPAVADVFTAILDSGLIGDAVKYDAVDDVIDRELAQYGGDNVEALKRAGILRPVPEPCGRLVGGHPCERDTGHEGECEAGPV